jgi:Do/DeqQ family serine protease
MRRITTHVLAIVLGAILTLGTLQIFPTWAVHASLRSPQIALTSTQNSLSDETTPTPLVAQAPAATSNTQSFVAAAVEQVGPAVVRIDTERTVTHNMPADPFLNDPLFRRFFGDSFSFPQGPYEERLQGQGSGFIISNDGLILTNAHVVDQADRVTVKLKDGRTFDGEVRGTDEVTDLAVVKINGGGNLPTVALGDSNQVKVGDWAIAVGNPFGLDNTVTLGIVSTLSRSSSAVGLVDKRLDFIQTDAAINPGNSGGPLLNAQGAVIGINTAIRANAMGIGFAIPINTAKEISQRLARGERVIHPYLGVQIANLTPELAKQNNNDPNSTIQLPEVNGALVTGVVPNSPAASAGIRRGDVIVQIDGQAVNTADQLVGIVENSQIGQQLRVTVRRGDRTQQFMVRPAEIEPMS